MQKETRKEHQTMITGSIMLDIYISVCLFILGSVMGSFLNCAGIRLMNGEPIAKARSHCMSSGHVLGAGELVPVFSWIFHKGRCRYCGEKISPRYLVTELVMGAAFVGTFLRFGISIETGTDLILICILLCASVCDMEDRAIPDRFFIMTVDLWILRLALSLLFDRSVSVQGLISSGIGAVVIPLALFGISLILEKILGRETLGMGDIKMFFALGFHLGAAKSFLNVILTCVIGLVAIAIQKAVKRPAATEEEEENPGALPLMPSIALSSFAVLMTGDLIINSYMSLIS